MLNSLVIIPFVEGFVPLLEMKPPTAGNKLPSIPPHSSKRSTRDIMLLLQSYSHVPLPVHHVHSLGCGRICLKDAMASLSSLNFSLSSARRVS